MGIYDLIKKFDLEKVYSKQYGELKISNTVGYGCGYARTYYVEATDKQGEFVQFRLESDVLEHDDIYPDTECKMSWTEYGRAKYTALKKLKETELAVLNDEIQEFETATIKSLIGKMVCFANSSNVGEVFCKVVDAKMKNGNLYRISGEFWIFKSISLENSEAEISFYKQHTDDAKISDVRLMTEKEISEFNHKVVAAFSIGRIQIM